VTAPADPIVKAVLDHGRGDVLLEGEALTQHDVDLAMRARFPDRKEYLRQRRAVLFVYADGGGIRLWRFDNDSPRVVDGKIIL
jgi:hypothetical protein